ncbi:hypothetical protein JVU11DRAFT_5097 [Chiua virens]|nr:hypothetical protein JVU11DRAFT_5097 [Chiua virens]
MRSFLVPSLLYFASYISAALSFNVSVGSSPTQCGTLDVSWTGGEAPFQIMLTPVFDVPRNLSIPSTAFSQNQGSYQISPIPFLKGTQFVLTMSDATGFGTGGTSGLFTVGELAGSASCNTTGPSLPFTFGLPSSLQQCSSYVFNDYSGAVLPATVIGLIPSGESFLLQTPTSGTSFSWVADVAVGTTIIFTMIDAKGNSGGSSPIEIVNVSNDTSCLNVNSPSSTTSFTPTSTSAGRSSTSSSTSSPSSSGVSTGTIVGAVIGVIFAIAVIAAIAVFCLKRQRSVSYGVAPTRNPRRHSLELDPGMDNNFQHGPIYPFPYQTDSVTRFAPPITAGDSPAHPASYQGVLSTPVSIHSPETLYTIQRHSRNNSNTESFAALGDVASSAMSSSGRRKAAMAGMSSQQPSTRFILHTDVEDLAPEDDSEVIELPPQYSERRAPVTRLAEERPMSSVTTASAGLAYLSGQDEDEPLHPISRPPH